MMPVFTYQITYQIDKTFEMLIPSACEGWANRSPGPSAVQVHEIYSNWTYISLAQQFDF